MLIGVPAEQPVEALASLRELFEGLHDVLEARLGLMEVHPPKGEPFFTYTVGWRMEREGEDISPKVIEALRQVPMGRWPISIFPLRADYFTNEAIAFFTREDEAKKGAPASPAPEGIGGLLILPLLGLIASPIRMIYQIYTGMIVPLANAQAWDALTNPSSPSFMPFYAASVGFELLINLFLVVFGVWVLWNFLRSKKDTPTLFILWVGAHVAVNLVEVLLLGRLTPQAEYEAALRNLPRILITALIWIPYFLLSKRVRNTFTR
ncbi:enhanced serine sensitivity protein SseB C-terminal domain-containing protein [Variovorax paradoxus]|nr:enhanced serine sensitivity protein SseB C-terminal domain-containing protein [Variovorax paradoxus]